MAWGGSLFKNNFEDRLPSGPADVAATMAKLLGLGDDVLEAMDCRPLDECLSGTTNDDGTGPEPEIFVKSKGSFQQILHRTVYKGRVYLDRGYRAL